MDMNNLNIIGRMTRDPESTEKYCKFSIAVNGYKDSTSFFNVVCFGKTGEIVGKYCKKGSQVALNGEIKQDQFTDKDGNKRSSVSIIANRVQFIGGKNENGSSNNNASNGSNNVDASNFGNSVNAELPF